MKLLLTSGGITNKKIADALLDLVGKPAGEIHVAFIPTAANASPNHKGWFIDNLYQLKEQNYKLIDIVDISALPRSVWQPRLEAADVLFFSGGVTPHLMYWLQESGLKDILPGLLSTRIYVGVSAGSMVTCPTLELTSREHKLRYKKEFGHDINQGLGYVDFHLRPHLNAPGVPENQKEFLEEASKKIPGVLYGIDNQTALKVVDGKVIDIVSEGEYVVLNK